MEENTANEQSQKKRAENANPDVIKKERINRKNRKNKNENYKIVEIYDPLKSSTPVWINRIDTSIKIAPPNCFQR